MKTKNSDPHLISNHDSEFYEMNGHAKQPSGQQWRNQGTTMSKC